MFELTVRVIKTRVALCNSWVLGSVFALYKKTQNSWLPRHWFAFESPASQPPQQPITTRLWVNLVCDGWYDRLFLSISFQAAWAQASIQAFFVL
jgi:hypothetical protein